LHYDLFVDSESGTHGKHMYSVVSQNLESFSGRSSSWEIALVMRTDYNLISVRAIKVLECLASHARDEESRPSFFSPSLQRTSERECVN